VSEIMLLGVLRAPHDPDNFLAMVQLIARAREAADRIEELEGALRDVVDSYDGYRRRGVNPAPAEYQFLVREINEARAVLEKRS
jgi:hypothetical protein